MGSILQTLRSYGKNALLSSSGEVADIIKKRATAPNFTMTSEGYLIQGIYDFG